MQEITFNGLGSIRIFPSQFEEDEQIFFHGTNGAYAEFIEKHGFIPSYKPIPDHFDGIIRIAEKMCPSLNPKLEDLYRQLKHVTGYFNYFTHISFTAVSLCAADYTIANKAGGQTIRNLVQLRDLLKSVRAEDIGDLNVSFSDRELAIINSLDKEVDQFKGTDGVVYAIRLQKEDINSLNYALHGHHCVMLCGSHIPPDRIVAKMTIPNTSTINPDLLSQANNHTVELKYSGRNRFIATVEDLNKDVHNFDALTVQLNK